MFDNFKSAARETFSRVIKSRVIDGAIALGTGLGGIILVGAAGGAAGGGTVGLLGHAVARPEAAILAAVPAFLVGAGAGLKIAGRVADAVDPWLDRREAKREVRLTLQRLCRQIRQPT